MDAAFVLLFRGMALLLGIPFLCDVLFFISWSRDIPGWDGTGWPNRQIFGRLNVEVHAGQLVHRRRSNTVAPGFPNGLRRLARANGDVFFALDLNRHAGEHLRGG
jgi:hypothetical protein